MKTYRTKGVVLGKCWGGGFGVYPSRVLEAKTLRGLLNSAKKAVKDGTLDSGMGFEYLKGALLNIEEIETIKINGKEYSRTEFSTELVGDLTEKEQDALSDYFYNI